jgi:hypothetical protein
VVPRRRDADHRQRHIVHAQRRANHIGIAAQRGVPEAIADYRNRLGVTEDRRVVLRQEPSEEWLHAHQPVAAARQAFRRALLPRARDLDDANGSADRAAEILDYALLRRQLGERGHRGAAKPFAAADVDRHQPIRPFDRQRAKDECVEHVEQGPGAAKGDGERDHDHDRKARCAEEMTNGQPKFVGDHCFTYFQLRILPQWPSSACTIIGGCGRFKPSTHLKAT